MKILVLATNYTKPNGNVSSHYIHSRNIRYQEDGHEVWVISFGTDSDYELEGIPILTLKSFERDYQSESFDILVSHAPNIRKHYRFLRKYGDMFTHYFFFFHGHEILEMNKFYPKHFYYVKEEKLKSGIVNGLYGKVKLKFWKYYFRKVQNKSHFIFVSDWLKKRFFDFMEITPKQLENRTHIIHNGVGKIFEQGEYRWDHEKNFDFITIRNELDKSTYAMDIVVNLAKSNSRYRFCVVGKGEFFNYFPKPNNLTWINNTLTHQGIVEVLNQAHCAFMPTRHDTQGVMACEMATYGIPVITSDIEVTKEIFEGFANVVFFDNKSEKTDLCQLYKQAKNSCQNAARNQKYYAKNTVDKEIALFKKVLEN